MVPTKPNNAQNFGRFYGEREALTRSPETLPIFRLCSLLARGAKFCRINQPASLARAPSLHVSANRPCYFYPLVKVVAPEQSGDAEFLPPPGAGVCGPLRFDKQQMTFVLVGLRLKG